MFLQLQKACLLGLLMLQAAVISDAAKVMQCPEGTRMEFANFSYTPCTVLIDRAEAAKDCLETRRCEFAIGPKKCRDYFDATPNLLYVCIPLDEPELQPRNHLSFTETFEVCAEDVDTKDLPPRKMHSGPKAIGEFKRPTEFEKRDVRRIMHEIKKEEWDLVLQLADRLNGRACRRVLNGYNILLILPKEGAGRTYSGFILMYRLNAPKPIVLAAPHGAVDLNTGKQAAYAFSSSEAMAAILPSYSRTSTSIKDKCQTSRLITDNSHSMENYFFHAVVGMAEAFGDSVFLEMHRCASCGNMRLGRAVRGRETQKNDFIRSWMKAVNNEIVPVLGVNNGFYAAVNSDAVKRTIFQPTPEDGSFFSTGSVIGTYLQGVRDLCAGEQTAENDSKRVLHIEQQGTVVTRPEAFGAAVNRFRDSKFMANRHVCN